MLGDPGALFLFCSSVYVGMLLVCQLMASEKCEHGLAGSLGGGNLLICCVLCSRVQVGLLCLVSAVPPSLQCCALCCLLYLIGLYIYKVYISIYRNKDVHLCSIFDVRWTPVLSKVGMLKGHSN